MVAYVSADSESYLSRSIISDVFWRCEHVLFVNGHRQNPNVFENWLTWRHVVFVRVANVEGASGAR
jgi:hypothetical protein